MIHPTTMIIYLGFVLLLAVFTKGRVYQAVPANDHQLSTEDIRTRIVGGQDAEKGQFPYQVAMYLDRQSFCGGSMIAKNWILSSAYCVDAIKLFTIFLGAWNMKLPSEPGRIAVITRNAITHENFRERGPFDNNVGLIKLPYDIQPNNQINIIPLPPRSFNDRDFTGQSVRVSGWGKRMDWTVGISDLLQFVDLTVISNEKCTERYGEVISDKIVCAQGTGVESTCQNDGGGPLVFKDENIGKTTHFGIVSFVSSGGCGSGAPSGYDRTYKYLDWIHEKTGIPIDD